ncbi:hypothetical protein GPK81_14310 [Blautia sp. MCC283]|nr:hypothetical protein [Blautia sp. MCC283]
MKTKACDRKASQTTVLIVGEGNGIIFSFSQCTVMKLKYRRKSDRFSCVIPGICVGQGSFTGIFQIIVSIEIRGQCFGRSGF